jgi:hypothetical protein
MQATEDCTRSSSRLASHSSSRPSSKTSSSPLPSAFTPAFLARLRRHEESFLERQAGLSGPWEVEALGSSGHANGARWAVVRRDEPLAEGGGVFALFRERGPALLTAAVLPSLGTPTDFHLKLHRGGPGYALHRGRKFLGHLARAEDRLLPRLDLARALAADPDALAQLIEAAGPEGLAILGRELARRAERSV